MYRKDEKQAKAFSKFFSGTKEQDRSASDEIPVDSKIKIHTPHDNEHQLQKTIGENSKSRNLKEISDEAESSSEEEHLHLQSSTSTSSSSSFSFENSGPEVNKVTPPPSWDLLQDCGK